MYTSGDKIAEWLEIYAKAMEIDFWGGARCTAARFDDQAREWVVTVTRDGETLTLRPRQLVLATGLSGTKHIPAIPGAGNFRGRQYHSADHGSGAGLDGKRCIVIGSNNSAHDICVDLWEHDAQVTMIQRSPTIVVRADTMGEVAKNIYYAQPGADIELADLMFAANPFRPRTAFEKGFTDYLRNLDADFYARLARSGFNLWHGEDETGFFMAYYRSAAGYYIDVGGSELIASGEIPVQRGEIAEIVADGVRKQDGSFLPADVIVYATGYRPMSEWVGQLISPAVERKVGPCWGLGSGIAGDPDRGKVNCATCGSPPRRKRYGSRAAIYAGPLPFAASGLAVEGAHGRFADTGLQENVMSRHADRSIIVTGAAGAIGYATSEILVREGAKVLLVDINAARLAERTATLRSQGARVEQCVADCGEEAAVQRYTQAALDAFGSIDGFFNNAGIEGKLAPTHEYEVAEFDRLMRVDLRGVFLGLRYVLPHMVKRGSGAVVNMASIGSERGLAGACAYNAAKHGVVGADAHGRQRGRAERCARELRDAGRDRDAAADRSGRTAVPRRCEERAGNTRPGRHPQPLWTAGGSRQCGLVPALGRGELRERRQVGDRRWGARHHPQRSELIRRRRLG